jgi:2-dehydropantoate 2-reductase
MGNAELLARCFGGERVVGGLCFVCLNRTAPGVVKNTNRGRVTFAALQPEGHPAAEAIRMGFEAAGIKADVLDSLDEALWRKLVWNIPFNGLAIAAGCVTTDIICADPSLRSLAWKLMREVQAAAASEDHQISDRFLEKQMERTAPMGPYQPSSLIDFQGNRAVEVEAIWGEPLRRARESGCPSPHLESLYLLLKGLVETRGK